MDDTRADTPTVETTRDERLSGRRGQSLHRRGPDDERGENVTSARVSNHNESGDVGDDVSRPLGSVILPYWAVSNLVKRKQARGRVL